MRIKQNCYTLPLRYCTILVIIICILCGVEVGGTNCCSGIVSEWYSTVTRICFCFSVSVFSFSCGLCICWKLGNNILAMLGCHFFPFSPSPGGAEAVYDTLLRACV